MIYGDIVESDRVIGLYRDIVENFKVILGSIYGYHGEL